MAQNYDNDINEIKSDLKTVFEKLAKCRADYQIKDHDEIIRVKEKQDTLTKELAKISLSQENISSKLETTTSALNMITDKVTNIIAKDNSKSKYYYNIISGVAIALLTALLSYIFVTASTTYIKTSSNNTTKEIISEKNDLNKKLDLLIRKLDNR